MYNWIANIEYSVLVSLGVISVALLIAIFSVHRLYVRSNLLEKRLIQLHNEVRAINSGNLGMGRKINQFAEEIANVEVKGLYQDTENVSEKTFQQAGLLLSRGATIEEVVDSCGIAPAEAELLAIMRHSSSRQTSTV
jgi:uncharacterized protein DUF2802